MFRFMSVDASQGGAGGSSRCYRFAQTLRVAVDTLQQAIALKWLPLPLGLRQAVADRVPARQDARPCRCGWSAPQCSRLLQTEPRVRRVMSGISPLNY